MDFCRRFHWTDRRYLGEIAEVYHRRYLSWRYRRIDGSGCGIINNNDERARIKRAINELLGSLIVEEKSYTDVLETSLDNGVNNITFIQQVNKVNDNDKIKSAEQDRRKEQELASKVIRDSLSSDWEHYTYTTVSGTSTS